MVEGAIEQIHNRPPDKPLCIYLPLIFPHPPYGVEDPWYSTIDRSLLPHRTPAPNHWDGKPSILKGIYERQNMQTWTEDRWTELRATYYGMCARTDHQFGMVLDALRNVGIYDESVIFFFSDHGDFTGDYGLVEKTQNTFEDCLTRVPFVVKPPAGVPVQPGIRDALVELIDFPATVEALTGINPEHTHFGRSLLPLITGETDSHRDAVFCQGGRVHGETHCMEWESPGGEDFLYWPRLSLQRGEGPEHSKATMIRTSDYKYVHRLYESDELYDLRNDPAERYNRIDNPALAMVRAELVERLLQFYLETSDVVPHQPDKRW
jgi:arylsulfatase A-like enzyme